MSKNIRISQFGGVGGGGQVSPFAPGRSPIGRGGTNSGGWDINVSWDDTMNFDKILSKTHQEMDTSDRNIESRLTPQHSNFEETKVYFLTPEERQREKLRRDLHNFNVSLEIEAKKIKEEDKQAKFRSEIQTSTMEESLGKRRIYKDKMKFDFEDDIPPQIKPERVHYANSKVNKQAQETLRRRNRITDEYPDFEQRNVYDEAQYSNPPIGRAPVLKNGNELEQYFSELREEAAPNDQGQRENANTDTVLTLADPDYNPNVHPRNEIANEPADDGVSLPNLFVSLEGNLHKDKSVKNRFDRNNPLLKEKMGPEEDGWFFYGIHSPSSFG